MQRVERRWGVFTAAVLLCFAVLVGGSKGSPYAFFWGCIAYFAYRGDLTSIAIWLKTVIILSVVLVLPYLVFFDSSAEMWRWTGATKEGFMIGGGVALMVKVAMFLYVRSQLKGVQAASGSIFQVETGLAYSDKAADALYEQALDELDSGKTSKATWARAMAEGAGDDAKTRAVYIRLRVSQLLGQVTVQPANPSAGNSPPSLASNSRSAAAVLGGAELDADRKFRRLQDEERNYRLRLRCSQIGTVLGAIGGVWLLFGTAGSTGPMPVVLLGALLGGLLAWCISCLFF